MDEERDDDLRRMVRELRASVAADLGRELDRRLGRVEERLADLER